MKYLFKIFLFILSINLNAQTDSLPSCGTDPLDSASFEDQAWYGNNDYLLNLLDSVGYYDIIGSQSYTIPEPGKFGFLAVNF